jgi:hypothetical protein
VFSFVVSCFRANVRVRLSVPVIDFAVGKHSSKGIELSPSSAIVIFFSATYKNLKFVH